MHYVFNADASAAAATPSPCKKKGVMTRIASPRLLQLLLAAAAPSPRIRKQKGGRQVTHCSTAVAATAASCCGAFAAQKEGSQVTHCFTVVAGTAAAASLSRRPAARPLQSGTAAAHCSWLAGPCPTAGAAAPSARCAGAGCPEFEFLHS